MRLIDADSLYAKLEAIRSEEVERVGRKTNKSCCTLSTALYEIMMMPTIEPERKIELDGTETNVEILSELRAQFNCFEEQEEPVYRALSNAIKALGQPERKKGKWIPCSERLPDEHKSILAKFKGTDRWTKSMWEKQSDEVVVTELFEDGTAKTATACTHDGEWYVEMKLIKREIIAWMPLPEPYKPEEQK